MKRKHSRWLRENQHIRYHYYPYTNDVVVVTNNPVAEVLSCSHTVAKPRPPSSPLPLLLLSPLPRPLSPLLFHGPPPPLSSTLAPSLNLRYQGPVSSLAPLPSPPFPSPPLPFLSHCAEACMHARVDMRACLFIPVVCFIP